MQMGYLYPHLPRDLPPCGVATTPNCVVLQQILTILVTVITSQHLPLFASAVSPSQIRISGSSKHDRPIHTAHVPLPHHLLPLLLGSRAHGPSNRPKISSLNESRAGDHKAMCKFASKDAPGYRTVIAALRQFGEEKGGGDASAVMGWEGKGCEAGARGKRKRWLEARELVRGVGDAGWENL